MHVYNWIPSSPSYLHVFLNNILSSSSAAHIQMGMGSSTGAFTGCPSQCCSVFLFFISLISMLLLLNNSNPYAPTLENTWAIKAGL